MQINIVINRKLLMLISAAWQSSRIEIAVKQQTADHFFLQGGRN